MNTGKIHVAGPMTDLVQRCTRCSAILTDYRNAMFLDGQPPPRGWGEGKFVTVFEGNPTTSHIGADESQAIHCDARPS